ncbi:hypothetical protein FBZ84_11517 [Azospirillum baldaniorum]|uniref:hypothetical protein n=1 Tax=Azospirillum baldaniorum TaxID=1064539 RepID=UPI0011AD381A|nr:hypothetical protein [Azospirillum baldaniorum]TWA59530.1 hypothetical protein FBZ84_11517 [Azospirillum baldaniorum]
MIKIVNLGRTGLYVAMQNGALTTIGGRSHWRSLDDIRSAVKAAKIKVSDTILRTVL